MEARRSSTQGSAPTAALLRAIQEFNDHRFFECHETLEALWLQGHSQTRLFYQGILQIAVGFLHVRRRNFRGAVRLMGSGIDKLQAFMPSFMGVDVEGLVRESSAALQWLTINGEARISSFDLSGIPKIRCEEDV